MQLDSRKEATLADPSTLDVRRGRLSISVCVGRESPRQKEPRSAFVPGLCDDPGGAHQSAPALGLMVKVVYLQVRLSELRRRRDAWPC